MDGSTDSFWRSTGPSYCRDYFSDDYVEYNTFRWSGCTVATGGCTDPAFDTDHYNEKWAYGVGLHEAAHCLYGLPDEGHPEDYYFCGHSIMYSESAYLSHVSDFCTILNGGKDSPIGHDGHPAENNNWDCIDLPSKLGIYFPYDDANTPDAFYKSSPQSGGHFPFAGSIVWFDETTY